MKALQLTVIVLLLTLPSPGQPARAEDVITIGIAGTGTVLPNSARPHELMYEGDERHLMDRIGRLAHDVDHLLARLHVLPPGLPGSNPDVIPRHDELAGLIDTALEHSPRLAPHRSRLAVQAAQTRQAGAKSDPMLQLSYMNLPLTGFELEHIPTTQFMVGLSRRFESYGKRGLKRRIAGISEDLTLLELQSDELSVIREVTKLYYEMVRTQARLRVITDNEALLKLLLELAELKYALGRTPQAQVLQAQTRLTHLEEQRISLQALLDRRFAMLRGLLGMPGGLELDELSLSIAYPLPRGVDIDAEALLAAALPRLPGLRHMDMRRSQQQYQVELARREYHPDYTLTASYGLREGNSDLLSAGIMFPLQTGRAERQDAAVQEAYAGLDLTDRQAAQLENTLATELATLLAELDRVHRLSGLYREGLLPQAHLALDAAIAGYAANQLDLAGLLQAQQDLLSYELELEQLYIDYIAALCDLQVITAGAFNPAPYLLPDPLAGSTDHNLTGALRSSISAAEHEPPAGAVPALTAEHSAESQVPPISPRFLESLGLPPVDENADRTGNGLQDDDAVETPEETVPGDEFYQPFIRTQEDENNG